MRNEEGNPSPPTPIFPSFAKTEFKLPLRMKPDVNVGFHCCDSIKHPLLRNVLSEYKKNSWFLFKERKSSTFCSFLLSILQYVHFTSAHGERLLYEMPIFVIIPTRFDLNGGGGCVLFLFNPTSNESVCQWQPQAHTTMFWDFFSITLELSSKYSTEMAWSLVGAQHGFGTLSGFIKCTWKQKKEEKNQSFKGPVIIFLACFQSVLLVKKNSHLQHFSKKKNSLSCRSLSYHIVNQD